MLQGNEPLHSALDVALVSRSTIKAIVGGVLAGETPCGGTRYVGRDYQSMRVCDGLTDGSEYRVNR